MAPVSKNSIRRRSSASTYVRLQFSIIGRLGVYGVLSVSRNPSRQRGSLSCIHALSAIVQISLEAHEYLADLLRATKVGDGISNRVVVFEPKQGRQLFLTKLLD